MGWFDIWKKHVIWAEGRRLDVYLDSKKIPTFGIGHNLIARPIKEVPPIVGFVTTDEIVDRTFNEDSKDAIYMVQNIFHAEFDSWSDNRKAGIVDLVFNMGAHTFLTFGPTIAHIRAGQWEDVARHLEGTKWYKDVKRRAPVVVKMIREG
jgi:GH24 family phage-related lysozyme (muramidase)